MGDDGALRERILNHVSERFFANGFSRTTTEELSSELGISKKTLYREFGSKEDILRIVVRQKMAELERNLDPVFEESDRPFHERVETWLRVIANGLHFLSKAFITDLARFAPDVWQEIEEFRHKKVLLRMEAIVRRGQVEGMVRPDVDPKVLMTIIFVVANNLLVPGPLVQLGIAPREMVGQLALLISQGILTEAGRLRLNGSAFGEGEV